MVNKTYDAQDLIDGIRCAFGTKSSENKKNNITQTQPPSLGGLWLSVTGQVFSQLALQEPARMYHVRHLEAEPSELGCTLSPLTNVMDRKYFYQFYQCKYLSCIVKIFSKC